MQLAACPSGGAQLLFVLLVTQCMRVVSSPSIQQIKATVIKGVDCLSTCHVGLDSALGITQGLID
jgi:hypothetical protein